MTGNTLFRALLAGLPMLLAVDAYAADSPPRSNKWRLQVSGDAESDGVMKFRVKPEDGAPIEVTATIEDGRSENGVARDIREAFQAQLPKGGYSVETDDGEDVLIKKDLGEPDFSVELVSSTVEDVRVGFDRE
jgi:hypothetical protein